VTYPDRTVRSAIEDRFVPLNLNLFQDREAVRSLNVIWTPTLLIADRRGSVHYRSLNFLPPAEFLDMLDIGEAWTRLRWGEYDRADDLLAGVRERHSDGALTAEAIYRRGIVTYLKTHSNAAMYEIWQELRDRFPTSIWTLRIP
jgi:hypothetical protein